MVRFTPKITSAEHTQWRKQTTRAIHITQSCHSCHSRHCAIILPHATNRPISAAQHRNWQTFCLHPFICSTMQCCNALSVYCHSIHKRRSEASNSATKRTKRTQSVYNGEAKCFWLMWYFIVFACDVLSSTSNIRSDSFNRLRQKHPCLSSRCNSSNRQRRRCLYMFTANMRVIA